MKRALATLGLVLLLVSMTACGKAAKGTDIPDVFGISYTDATDILKAEGFEVSAIETEVGNISEKLLYPLEKVSKGTVFKVDNYILDNLGNLTKDYDVYYEGELVSEDKSVVIYYAKEDYVLKKEETKSDKPIADDASSQETEKTPEVSQTPEKEPEKSNDDNGLNPDFKAAMDSYENFMNEYVAFMKKYKANPSDLSLLADYADYMSKYADFAEDFEDWENEDMNAAETAYYIEVQSRVSKKLLEVAS